MGTRRPASAPTGYVAAEHRSWGQNYEQPWIEQAWGQGFATAYDRMLEEAQTAGAHGVVGVIDTADRLGRPRGARVPAAGHRGPGHRRRPAAGRRRPWTTYLAGQRLAKLIEAG